MLHLCLLAVAFALAADPAHAGPVAGVFAAIGAFIGQSAILTGLAQMGASMVLSAVARKLSSKKPAEQQRDVSFDIEMGDTLPLSVILGTYATAGRRKYIGVWGRNQRLVTEVIEVSALPHAALDGIWIGDEEGQIDRSKIGQAIGDRNAVETISELANNGNLAGGYSLGHPVQIPSLEGRRRIWVRWVDGTQTTIDPFLSWAFGADADYPWDGIGTGKSFAIVTSLYDEDVLSGYPTFLLQPSPLPLYDPRKDGSTGGSGAHRWGNRASYEPSSNAALIAYNIARGIYWGDEWVFGGRNLPSWRLPRGEWVAAINACERATEVLGGGSEPAYRGGCEVVVDQAALAVLEELGRAANMRFAEVGGTLKPCVDLPGAAVFSITDEDIVTSEGQSFTPFFPLTQTYNAISATYPEPREKWSTKDAPERIDVTAQALDGGRYLPVAVSYPACPFGAQVQRLMVSQMADYRRMRQHLFTLPPEAYALEPLDMISWTSARNGYVQKKFVIEQVSKMPGFNVVVALREVDPADYDWHGSMQLPQVITNPANVIALPQGIEGWTAVPVLLAGNNGKGRKAAIQVSCGGNEIGVSEIRIQVERGGVVQFDLTRPYGAPYQWTLTDVVPEATYRVRAALISQLTGRYEWSYWITLTTPAVPVWIEQLSGEIFDAFEQMAKEGGIQVVNTLPAAGDFADQIVLRRTDKRLFRWDAPTGTWSDSVYAGLADNSVTTAKVVAGAIVANHLAANSVLASHIGAGQVTAEKIAALSIEAVHIKGGAVTGDKIAGETITASKLVKSQNLITHTAQIGELVLTTPLLAPNTISRVINVSRSGSGGGGIYTTAIPSSSPYRGGQGETRTNMVDYLTGSIWAPYTYDLYFWVTLAGQNMVCNLFRNGDNTAYQGYQFRTSLDTFTPAGQFINADCSASMVGVVPSVSGTQSLTIAAALMANREGNAMSSGSLTMMAVMK